MNLRFLSAAQEEYSHAAAWYLEEEQSPQAALRFVDEVENVCAKILLAPLRYPIRKHGFRAWPLRHFPYSILHKLKGEEVIVASLQRDSRSNSFLNERNV